MHSTSRPALASLLFMSAVSSVASAQSDTLRLETPRDLFELETTVAVRASAPTALSVFLGPLDVTADTTILSTQTLEDGGFEYVFDLSNLARNAGDTLRFRYEEPSPLGPVVTEATIEIEANVEIDAYSDRTVNPTGPTVEVAWHDMQLDTSALAVFLFGSDVTAFVPIVGPLNVVWQENPLDPTRPHLRVDRYQLDFSALGGFIPPDGAVELLAYGLQPDGTFSHELIGLDTDLVMATAEGDCVKEKIAAFLRSIGLEKNGDCTSISATPAQVDAAAERLAADLETCTPRMGSEPEKVTYTDSSGDSVDVVIDFSATGDASASASADAVIAVSGGNGGDAAATNRKKCGAAVAVAGDGRSGSSSPGAGGNASATSGKGGQATANAGDGGSANPKTGSGGNGGTSTATTPGGANTTNPGTAGGPGVHGGGGHSQTSGNSSSGGAGGPYPN